MEFQRTAVITSINSRYASGSARLIEWSGISNCGLIVIGDTTTPLWDLAETKHARFLSLEDQRKRYPDLSNRLPIRHYSRKNIGYLEAFFSDSDILFDTDDDNCPQANIFETEINTLRSLPSLDGWVNVYKYFGSKDLWPRGLPLSAVHRPLNAVKYLELERPLSIDEIMTSARLDNLKFGVFQSVVDGDPDLDAIGRMLFPEEFHFNDAAPLVLRGNQNCPTNSQATLWRRELTPLLYLPTTSSFRMTDIYRGIILQEFMSYSGFISLYGKLPITQRRNQHNLLNDFSEEIEGHLKVELVREIAKSCWQGSANQSLRDISNGIFSTYSTLVQEEILFSSEMPALESFLSYFQ